MLLTEADAIIDAIPIVRLKLRVNRAALRAGARLRRHETQAAGADLLNIQAKSPHFDCNSRSLPAVVELRSYVRPTRGRRLKILDLKSRANADPGKRGAGVVAVAVAVHNGKMRRRHGIA